MPIFFPAPGGLEVSDLERILLEVSARSHVAGLGITGLTPGADPALLAGFASLAGL
jgi:hypothetical protein